MKHTYSLSLILIAVIFLTGCAIISVPLVTPLQKLEERIIEGKGKDKILVLDISGIISEKKRPEVPLRGETSMIEDVREALKKAEGDRTIRGLIVRINSPGGSTTGSDILHHEIVQFKKSTHMHIIASLMNVGTSGGYYVATAADEIVAHPTTITGSIAVIALKFNMKGLLDLIGIKEETVKSGKMKDIWSPFRPSTEAERKIMQEVIDTFHARFIDVVVKGRTALSRQEIELLADERIYTADQALEAKLIDHIGYLDDAIAMMKNHLTLTEATIITYGRPGTFKETIYSQGPPISPQTLNIINVQGVEFLALPELHFMYLWIP